MPQIARNVKEQIGLHKKVQGSHLSKNIKPYKKRINRTSPDVERINDTITGITKGAPVDKSVNVLKNYASGIIDNTKRYKKVMNAADTIKNNKDLIEKIVKEYKIKENK